MQQLLVSLLLVLPKHVLLSFIILLFRKLLLSLMRFLVQIFSHLFRLPAWRCSL